MFNTTATIFIWQPGYVLQKVQVQENPNKNTPKTSGAAAIPFSVNFGSVTNPIQLGTS